MLVGIHGSADPLPSFKGSNLVIPCSSVGMSPFIGLDLFILNDSSFRKVGYYKSECVQAGVSNDGLSLLKDQG